MSERLETKKLSPWKRVTALTVASLSLISCGSDREAETPEATVPTYERVTNGSPSVVTFGDDDEYNDIFSECDGPNRVFRSRRNSYLEVVGNSSDCTGLTAHARALLTFAVDNTTYGVYADCDGPTRIYKITDGYTFAAVESPYICAASSQQLK